MKKFYRPEYRKTKRIVLIVWTFVILSLPITGRSDVNPSPVPLLVSSQWLEENKNNSDIVILHISSIIRDYDNGHIPGASFLWPGWVAISTEKESTVPADPNEMERVLKRLGVSNNSHIVLYGCNGNLVVVCRIFVTLCDIGLAGRISILDGGFEDWKSSGRKISSERTEVKEGKLSTTKSGILKNGDWMAKNFTNKEYFLIDARAKTSYEGTAGTGRPGHIPGAKNLPATEMYNGKTFHFSPAVRIKELFENLEIPEGTRPVFYCQTGNLACIDYVAAIIAGYDPYVYDGSMEDWSSRSDMPVENN
jgi:thiosulfate/3-mercaptopyruvate sulfurtransferase